MTTAKVAISADFLTAFAHLPRQVQGKVTELVNKFRNDPASPGIHYEKINFRFLQKIFERFWSLGPYFMLRVSHSLLNVICRKS